MSFKNK
jgi:hypothetical protein